jgi:hypothetical protein
MGTSEIYKRLKEGVSHCPKVKAVTPATKGNATLIKGSVYIYTVNTVSGQIKLGRTMTKPFMILFAIIVGFLAWAAASIGWDMAEGGYYFREYTILVAIGLLVIGLFGAVVIFLGERESKVVLPDIRKALEPNPIIMPTDEQHKRLYTITIVVFLAASLVGIVILIFALVDLGFAGRRSYSGMFMRWVTTSAFPLVIGLLVINLFGAVLTFLGEKKSKVVLSDIRKALKPNPITMLTLVVFLVASLVGIVNWIINWVERNM